MKNIAMLSDRNLKFNLIQTGFYSDLITKVFSNNCLNRLEKIIGKSNVGFISLQIDEFYSLVDEFGADAGLRFLQLMEEIGVRDFEEHFEGCRILYVENVNINQILICFQMPDDGIFRLPDNAISFRLKIGNAISQHSKELIGKKAVLRVGYSWISKHNKDPFYETIFKAFCNAKLTRISNDSKVGLALQNQFVEICEKTLLRFVYQPIIKLNGCDILGWEALARGPEKSHFSTPNVLFSYAEKIGKTYSLDKKCCREAMKYLGHISPKQRLFMNVNSHSLNDPVFHPESLIEHLSEFNLTPDNIVLECAEDRSTEDQNFLISNLEYYRKHGFKVAVDGFGYSSIRFVSQIQPDYIKMDGSLIREIAHSSKKRTMAEGIVNLAEKMGCKVIAMGIETESEIKTLASIGVHFGQGYYIARPAFPKPEKPIVTQQPDSISIGLFRRKETSLRELVQTAIIVPPDILVAEVKSMTENKPPLCGIVVAENNKPLGLVMRYHLDRQLGTRYGVSLFYQRSISCLMDTEPLIIDCSCPLGEAAKEAVNREPAKIYDDVIVTEKGMLLGTVSVQNMMEMLAKMEIRNRENAEAATRAKSEFLANMSHDIRTPMNAILGMADLLSESPLTLEQKKFVSVFQNAGESLLELINDILDLSKVEAGQIELETVEFNLLDVVEKTCEIMAIKVHQKNVELISYVDPDIPLNLNGDPARLRQIISNLLGNAVKFTDNGEIAISIQKYSETEQMVTLHFFVSDTGVGIPSDKIDQIFETFGQAHSHREYGGTGLGLSICRQLVKLMGGRIWVESEPGKGSTFHFTANFHKAEQTQYKYEPLNLEGISAIVVDDNATSRGIIHQFLAYLNAKVIVAKSGKECLDILENLNKNKKSLQLIFLDSQMPEMDGFETALNIKSLLSLEKQIVMLVPCNIISEAIVKIKEIGIGGHIVKPIKRKEFEDTICRVLGRTVNETASADLTCTHAAPKNERNPLRILLAEDNENNRTLFLFYLKNSPHHLEIAENGLICFEKYISGSYDVIFMDIDMPVMDGYKATNAIRSWEIENNRPPVHIVALTAHALKGKREESINAGCTDHMTKPFKKAQLFAKLDEIVGKHSIGSNDGTLVQDQCQNVEVKDIVYVDDEIKPLIPGFIQNIEKELKELDRVIEAMDYALIQRLGHRIKGASSCFCFNKMSDIASRIEDAGREKRAVSEIQDFTDQLKSHFYNLEIVYRIENRS